MNRTRNRHAPPRILVVDDEPRLLRSTQLILGKQYDVTVAESGVEALDLLTSGAPFTVVLSDMRMPGMSGAELLAQVRARSPHTVRILLTGQADRESVQDAVNNGGIRRFLTKPVSATELGKVIADAVREFDIARAERAMMEDTLVGAIDMVTEVLAMANPLAFGRARRVRSLMGHVASRLDLTDIWLYELAGLLSQLGAVTIPAAVLERLETGERLSSAERLLIDEAPHIAQRLVQRIPRLEPVAEMIGGQQLPDNQPQLDRALTEPYPEQLGAYLLQTVMCFDDALREGLSESQAVTQIQARGSPQLPRVLAILLDSRATDGQRSYVTSAASTIYEEAERRTLHDASSMRAADWFNEV